MITMNENNLIEIECINRDLNNKKLNKGIKFNFQVNQFETFLRINETRL
jgi:hypothetical protein